jgi:hypothetical protein
MLITPTTRELPKYLVPQCLPRQRRTEKLVGERHELTELERITMNYTPFCSLLFRRASVIVAVVSLIVDNHVV